MTALLRDDVDPSLYIYNLVEFDTKSSAAQVGLHIIWDETNVICIECSR